MSLEDILKRVAELKSALQQLPEEGHGSQDAVVDGVSDLLSTAMGLSSKKKYVVSEIQVREEDQELPEAVKLEHILNDPDMASDTELDPRPSLGLTPVGDAKEAHSVSTGKRKADEDDEVEVIGPTPAKRRRGNTDELLHSPSRRSGTGLAPPSPERDDEGSPPRRPSARIRHLSSMGMIKFGAIKTEPVSNDLDDDEPTRDVAAAPANEKRGRGRPKKLETPVSGAGKNSVRNTPSQRGIATTDSGMKRGPGRPKKLDTSTTCTSRASVGGLSAKKPGAGDPTRSAEPKRGPGRPRKSDVSVSVKEEANKATNLTSATKTERKLSSPIRVVDRTEIAADAGVKQTRSDKTPLKTPKVGIVSTTRQTQQHCSSEQSDADVVTGDEEWDPEQEVALSPSKRVTIKDEPWDEDAAGRRIKRRGPAGRTSTDHHAQDRLIYKEFRCFLCPEETDAFASEDDLGNHWEACHSQLVKGGISMTCPRAPCGFMLKTCEGQGAYVLMFILQSTVLRHLVHVHSEPIPRFVKDYPCAKCNFNTVTLLRYKTHMQAHALPVYCMKCGRFPAVTSYRGHMKECYGDHVPVFFFKRLECFMCSKMPSPRSEDTLVDHMVEHMTRGQRRGSFTLYCHFCQAGFSYTRKTPHLFHTFGRYLQHIVQQHGCDVPSCVVHYPCPVAHCGYVALNVFDLSKHLTEHEDVPNDVATSWDKWVIEHSKDALHFNNEVSGGAATKLTLGHTKRFSNALGNKKVRIQVNSKSPVVKKKGRKSKVKRKKDDDDDDNTSVVLTEDEVDPDEEGGGNASWAPRGRGRPRRSRKRGASELFERLDKTHKAKREAVPRSTLIEFSEFFCYLCEAEGSAGQQYGSLPELLQHTRESHIMEGGKGGMMACPLCPLMLKLSGTADHWVHRMASNLLAHTTKKHKTPIPSYLVSYPCGDCSQVFVTQWTRGKHRLVHAPPITCQQCGKTMSCTSLAGHSAQCKGSKELLVTYLTFKCFLCNDEVFETEAELERHNQKHILPIQEKRKVGMIRCVDCSKIFAVTRNNPSTVLTMGRYLQHRIYDHKDPAPDFVKLHACPEGDCKFQALRLSDLSTHIADVHRGNTISNILRQPAAQTKTVAQVIGACDVDGEGGFVDPVQGGSTITADISTTAENVKLESGTLLQVSTITQPKDTVEFIEYKCMLCDCEDQYLDIATLVMHIQTHHQAQLGQQGEQTCLKCAVCDTTISLPSLPDGSTDCDSFLQSYGSLLEHMVIKHDERVPRFAKSYTCVKKSCKFVSLRWSTMTEHYETHGGFKYCQACDKLLAWAVFERHNCSKRSVGREHGLEFVKRQCFMCGEQEPVVDYADNYSMQLHMVTHFVETEGSDIPVLPCRQCNLGFTLDSDGAFMTVSMWLHHMMRQHQHPVPSSLREYRCREPGCDYYTFKKSGQNNHYKTHRKHLCMMCGQIISCHSRTEHSRNCGKDKLDRQQFECSDCGKRFLRKETCIKHVQKKHQGLDIKTYSCNLCNMAYYQKSFLEHHLYRKHGVNISERPVMQCSHCDFTHIYSKTMEKHLQTHEDGKPSVCPVCFKAFRAPELLKQHMCVHDEKSTFPCVFCNYVPKRLTQLRRHLRTVHRTIENSIKIGLAAARK